MGRVQIPLDQAEIKIKNHLAERAKCTRVKCQNGQFRRLGL